MEPVTYASLVVLEFRAEALLFQCIVIPILRFAAQSWNPEIACQSRDCAVNFEIAQSILRVRKCLAQSQDCTRQSRDHDLAAQSRDCANS